MKKFLTLTAAAFAASIAASAAQAATLDFVAEAAGAERGITNGSSFSSANFGGLTLTFTSHNTDTGADAYFPYFDDLSGGLPGGLGVCKNLSTGVGASATGDDGAGDDCNPNNDDNTTIGEGVSVGFPGVFDVSGLSFTDEDHLSLNSSDALLRIITDNGNLVLSFAEAVAQSMQSTIDLLSVVTFVRFEFFDPWDGEGTQFYVNGFTATEVPIPGALPLLLSGIAGLGFASRRRKKA